MRIGRILIVAVVVVAALFVAGIAVLMNLDFNEYKQQITAEVKKATGRGLVIEGDLKLNIFTLSPGLAVDGVRFANASWGSRPDMAKIDRFEVKVSILPLLSGVLDVNRVVLTGADILVERDKDGRGNYEFETMAKSDAPASEKPASSPGPASLPAVEIGEIQIEDANLTYRDGRSGQELKVALRTLLLRRGAGQPLELRLVGAYNDAPFSAKGDMGGIVHLLGASKPWPLAITVEAGGATAKLHGAIANPAAMAGLDLALSVTGDDLSGFGAIAQAPVPPLGPYAVATKIAGGIESSIELRDLLVKMGGSSVSGNAVMQLSGKPILTATLASDLIDLADFTKRPPGGSGGAAPEAKSQGSAGRGDDGRLFPADPLPLDGLKAANVNVDLSVKKLLAQGVPVENLQVKVELREGDLTIRPIDAVLASGKLAGAIRLNAARRTPVLNVDIAGKKVHVGKLLTDLQITDLLYGVINTNVKLRGQGRSVRALMASLNGNTSVVMGKGRMKSEALDLYVGGAATVLTELVAGDKSEYTVINCFVNQFDVKNGLATSKIMLFDTEYTTVSGKGDIDLRTEKIDYEVDPRPKSATVTTTVPVTIGGTLASPSLGVNKLAAAAKVGGLIGTVLFPPAAIAGLADLGTADDNPCVKRAKAGGKAASEKPSESKGVTGTIEGVGKDMKERLDRGLKQLFGQ